ncbi:helix-turn-helix domain-containing protein [Streptomyces sp. NPDC002755]
MTKSPDEVVAENARRVREYRGLTQARVAELAAEAGYELGEMAVWSLEKGRRKTKISDLYALGSALGVAPESLLREGFDMEGGPAEVDYEVRLDGGTIESVTADTSYVDSDGWINFFRRGQRVFFAPSSRVLCCRAGGGVQ